MRKSKPATKAQPRSLISNRPVIAEAKRAAALPANPALALVGHVGSEFRITPGVGYGYDRKPTLVPLDGVNLLLVLPLGFHDPELHSKALIVIEERVAGEYTITKIPTFQSKKEKHV